MKKNKSSFKVYDYNGTLKSNSGNVPAKAPRRKIPFIRHILFILIIITAVLYAIDYYQTHFNQVQNPLPRKEALIKKSKIHCLNNQLDKVVIVSISERHLWACNYTNELQDAPVITGNQGLASDLTPIGNYKIYDKKTNFDIIGNNATDSWNDHVSYLMSFLRNQYGYYAFHDATWRQPNSFGNISPNSKDASHGCVETPLATAEWLYKWTDIGTNISIIN